MEYENLDNIKAAFGHGEFKFPTEILVANIKFKLSETSKYDMRNILFDQYKPMVVYITAHKQQASEAGLNTALVFLWGMQSNHHMVPYDVRTYSRARLEGRIIKEEEGINSDKVSISKERIVGDCVDVIITSLPNSTPMKGKVDTGADVSSIHAENWKVDNGQVTFECPELSENRITLPVIEKQAIKSSNGDIEYRPVITLNIRINDQQLTNIMFNLNDRGTMNYPMLVGQNILEAGKFMIDPTIDDPDDPDTKVDEYIKMNIDWELIQEELKKERIPESNLQLAQQLINTIKDN